jgi:hypothetical protein
MLDLKPCLDAVNAAKDEEQRIANEIQTLLSDGTEESKLKAVVELQPTLDEAQKKLAQAEALYESMQRANRPNDIAKNFVPISNSQPEDEVDHQSTTIKRSEYNKLSLVDQARFIRSGGTLED